MSTKVSSPAWPQDPVGMSEKQPSRPWTTSASSGALRRGQGALRRGQARDSGFKPKSFSIDTTFLATSRFDSAKHLPRYIRSDALSG